MQKKAALSIGFICVAATAAHAVPLYSGIVLSTSAGTAEQLLSGIFCLAASSSSAGSCAVSLNGETGIVALSSFSIVSSATATYATLASSAAAFATAPSLCSAEHTTRGISASGAAQGCSGGALSTDGSVQLSTGGVFGASNLFYGWTTGVLSLGGNGTMSLDGADIFTSTGPLNLYAGASPGSVVASSVTIAGENAPAGANVARNGGSVTLTGGSAYLSGSGIATGGAVNIAGGAGTTPGTGGAVNISGGLGASTGTIDLSGETVVYNPNTQLAVSTFDAVGDLTTLSTVSAGGYVGSGAALTNLPPKAPAGVNGSFQWNSSGFLAGASDVLAGKSIGITGGLLIGSTVTADSSTSFVYLATSSGTTTSILIAGTNGYRTGTIPYLPLFIVDSQQGITINAPTEGGPEQYPAMSINVGVNGGSATNTFGVISQGTIIINSASTGYPPSALDSEGPIVTQSLNGSPVISHKLSLFDGRVPGPPIKNNDANIYSNLDGLLFSVGGSTTIYISSSNGRVGIGAGWSDSLQPAHQLDVAGTGRFSGVITAPTFTVSGYFQLYSQTTSQLRAIAPSGAGQVYWCSDCTGSGATTAGMMVVSTGTAAGNFKDVGLAFFK